jgi:predicted glycoside hydrolase/deacetylase ChbG (UPF0249 family)
MLWKLKSNLSAVCALLVCFAAAPVAEAQMQHIAERLGYAPNAKLLIIHADDLGVAHSVDMAAFKALNGKAVSSASVMVPCPWLTEVAEYFRAHPDVDLGLHLTVTSEWKTYRWGPVAPADQVSSLLDPHGFFYADTMNVARHAKPEEARREIEAQIARAESLGIHPTHLDIHMGAMAATRQLYAELIQAGRQHHVPFMAVHVTDARQNWMQMFNSRDVVLDSMVMFEPGVPPAQWTSAYVKALDQLKPGVNELIVHLGYDNAELQAVTVDHPDYGAAWRQRDFKAVTSPEFKQALARNQIHVIGWKDLKKVQYGN